MDTTEQKLAELETANTQAWQRIESLCDERDALVAKVARLEELNRFCEEETRSFIDELTTAKRENVKTLHELAITKDLVKALYSGFGPNVWKASARVSAWCDIKGQQTKAPLLTRVSVEKATIRNLTPYPLDIDWEFQVTEGEIKLTGVIIKTEESDPEAEAEQAKEAMWEKER